MIHIVSGNKEQILTTDLSANSTQGRWAYMDGQNASGDPQVTPVGSSAAAQYDRHRLVCIGKVTISQNDGDPLHETIYINNGGTNDDGRKPYMIIGAGIAIEDDELDARVTGDFEGADFGAAMSLTTSGYATLTGASDAVGSATKVAYFDNIKGDVVTYVTDTSAT